MIGQTISHYKILEKLGEGGMGIVYKAHDTSLDRDVALKFLPHDLTTSDEERTRFIHEAKAASALDHPNICTIYEVAETPDGRLFIAMGYYEGESLTKKIQKGRLKVEEAVGIAIQVAEGLQAAHNRGIVHRDIKSGNIIATNEGQVKILDFGLAHKSGLSRLTRTGTTVGTAPYMSPEQAKGERVDHRSDLWSLGIVLYEMVTGRLPFRGEHEAAILYSVVNEEPLPLEVSLPDASPDLIHFIRRALEKDAAERYQSAADMLIDLRRLKKETSRTGFQPVRRTSWRAGNHKTRALAAAGMIVVLIIAGYLLLMRKGPEINPDYVMRWMNLPFNTIDVGLAITRDGKWVIFGAKDDNGRWDLYVASIKLGEPRRVTQDSSDGVLCPDLSPDGTTIVYNQISGTTFNICTVSFNGGIATKIGVGNEPAWSPDGKRIGYVLDPTELGTNPYQPSERAKGKSGNGEFWTMNPDGSGNTLEFVDSVAAKSYSNVWFSWSPDGRSVAWSHRSRRNNQESGEIIIHDLNSHSERTVVPKGLSISLLSWTPNDQLIYSARLSQSSNERSLWMVAVTGGVPVRITRGLANTGSPKLSADGKTLIFLLYKDVGHLWLAKTDGPGERTEVKVNGEPYFICPSISPDGKYITVVVPAFGGAIDDQVWIFRRDGTNMHQITTGNDYHWWPTWSLDGKKIFYYARGFYDEYKSFKVYAVNVPKIDAPRFLSSGDAASWADSVSLLVRDQDKMWRTFVDGRPRQKFSEDSIWAQMFGGGKYVIFLDMHQRALLENGHESNYVCRIEDWNGSGAANARAIPANNAVCFDQLYVMEGSDIYRVSLPDLKMVKLEMNLKDRDAVWSGVSTTRDGKEMVYSSLESVNKIGVIQDLFK